MTRLPARPVLSLLTALVVSATMTLTSLAPSAHATTGWQKISLPSDDFVVSMWSLKADADTLVGVTMSMAPYAYDLRTGTRTAIPLPNAGAGAIGANPLGVDGSTVLLQVGYPDSTYPLYTYDLTTQQLRALPDDLTYRPSSGGTTPVGFDDGRFVITTTSWQGSGTTARTFVYDTTTGARTDLPTLSVPGETDPDGGPIRLRPVSLTGPTVLLRTDESTSQQQRLFLYDLNLRRLREVALPAGYTSAQVTDTASDGTIAMNLSSGAPRWDRRAVTLTPTTGEVAFLPSVGDQHANVTRISSRWILGTTSNNTPTDPQTTPFLIDRATGRQITPPAHPFDIRDVTDTAVISGDVSTLSAWRPTLAMTPATPTISGTAKVGYTLKVTRGTWAPSGVTLTQQWYRNGTKIAGATGTTRKLTSSDRGKRITVKVTGTKSGYTTLTRTSARTSIVR